MPNIIITGATRGIGFGMASEFMKRGCNVFITGRDPKRLIDALVRLNRINKKVTAEGIISDAGTYKNMETLWNKAAKAFGTIDIWVNNAGIPQDQEAVWNLDPVQMESLVKTNILGMMYGTRTAISHMIRQGHGAVYNMEGLGSNRMIIKDNVLYGTSKAALTYFTAGAVKEAKGSPVIVGFLSPGMVVTDFLKSSKPEGHPESAIRIFNLLADKVETVTPFLVNGMLENKKHGRRIAWLTTGKMIRRFMFGWITGRKVME